MKRVTEIRQGSAHGVFIANGVYFVLNLKDWERSDVVSFTLLYFIF